MPRSWPLWIVALISLGVGVMWSIDARRLNDFFLVTQWTEHLRAGMTPFTPEIGADYPPWALVTLLPLTWVPPGARVDLWVLANLALVVAIVTWFVRRVDESPSALGWLAALLCSVACFRVLGQFSILSFALALIGVSTASPVRGGLWLGLALMKPQVGGVMWIAHAALRDWRRVSVALAVPVGLTLIAAGLLQQHPVDVIRDYASVVRDTHGGDLPFLGHTELESWLWRAFQTGTSLAASGTLVLVLLLPGWLAVVANPQPVRGDQDRVWEWYAFVGAVSLLATRHLSYDLLLLVPLLVAWRSRPASDTASSATGRTGFVVLATLLVLDIPGWWRRVLAPLGLPSGLGVVQELDRILVLAVWLVLLIRLLSLFYRRKKTNTI